MARYLLDTNLFRYSSAPKQIRASLRLGDSDVVYRSVITVREILRGILSLLADGEPATPRQKSPLDERYRILEEVLEGIRRFPLHSYSKEADTLFQSWPASVKRIGPNDCRILVVLTRNTSDFERIAAHEPRARFRDTRNV